MNIAKLRSIRRILLTDCQDPLLRCMQNAADFLSGTSSDELLDNLVQHPIRRNRMVDCVSRLDHIGFVAFVRSAPKLKSLAAAAGFGGLCRRFPSRILERELGQLAGLEIVPTTIFKAYRALDHGATTAVEIFLPHSIDTRLVRRWIESGCAVHVAFAISDAQHFPEVISIMVKEGFRPPSFTRGQPLMNDIENMTALYFDGQLGGEPMRIEFCHFPETATPRACTSSQPSAEHAT